jgi:hypothetical protein
MIDTVKAIPKTVALIDEMGSGEFMAKYYDHENFCLKCTAPQWMKDEWRAFAMDSPDRTDEEGHTVRR